MKKILYIILFIIILFILSCKNNSSSSIGKVGEIVVDPYGVTPLSAVYTTEAVNAAPVTVKVKGLYGEPDIIHTYPAGYGTEFEIHGMFPESQNTIEVNDGGRIITKNIYVNKLIINGESIPSKINIDYSVLTETEKYQNNPNIYFLHYIYGNWGATASVAISKNGYLRYALTKYTPSKIRIENNKFIFYTFTGYTIVDMLGNVLINFKNWNHHDAIKVGDNYLYLSSSLYGSQDMLGVADKDGNDIKFLSFGKLFQDVLDISTYPEDLETFKEVVYGESVNNIYIENGIKKNIDWCHANSLVYDSETDILYVSSRNRGVLAIDYSEWKLIWWMVNENNTFSVNGKTTQLYNLKSLDKYRVKGDAITEGPSGQHALFLLANGNLGMFDNQVESKKQSRYIEYQISKIGEEYQAKIVSEIYVDKLHAVSTSDVDFVGDNYENLLLTFGDVRKVVVELEKNTKEKLFQCSMNFGTYLYRADKMPLYYDEGRVYSEDCNLKNPN